MRPRWKVPKSRCFERVGVSCFPVSFIFLPIHPLAVLFCLQKKRVQQHPELNWMKKTCWKWDGKSGFAEFRQAKGCSVSLSFSIIIVTSCSLPFQVLHCITWRKTPNSFVHQFWSMIWKPFPMPIVFSRPFLISSPHNGVGLDPVFGSFPSQMCQSWGYSLALCTGHFDVGGRRCLYWWMQQQCWDV